MSDAAPARSCSYLDFKENFGSYASAVVCKPGPGTGFCSRRACPFIPTLIPIVVRREPYLAEVITDLNLGMEGPPPDLRTAGHSLIKPNSSHAIRARTAPRRLLRSRGLQRVSGCRLNRSTVTRARLVRSC